MRTATDALLSVRRYVSNVLPGPPWAVVLAADPGAVERPYAVVATADGASTQHEVADTMRNQLPVVVHAFPPVGDRPSRSKLIAERVADALRIAVAVGVPDRRVQGVRGFPQRIPLFDYGGVMAEDYTNMGVLGQAVTARNRPDYLLVADGFKAQAMQQADEGQLFVATLELRVQWFSPTGLRSEGTALQELRLGIYPS